VRLTTLAFGSLRAPGRLGALPLLVLLAAVFGCSPAALLSTAERAVRRPVGAGGCGDFTSEPRPVSIIVVGADSEPLPDLKVTCSDSAALSGRTDDEGQITLARTEECSAACGCHTTCAEVEIQHPAKRSLSHVAAIRGDAVRIVLSDFSRTR
jgi:hypothetical protein